MKRILNSDAATGKQTVLRQESDGSTFIEKTQNFDNLLKINKQMSDDWRKGDLIGTQKHVQHIAEIPNVVYHHLLKTLGKPSENPKAWKEWLNSSDNRAFRTGGGNI